MKVLLAEDSLTMMLTTSAVIKDSGHDVIQARDGKEALSLYASENPDLILLDVEMPEYTGYEVAEIIRSDTTGKWVPIIFLTGCVGDEHLLQGINAGGDDYLTKPVSRIVLNAKLNAMHRISEMQNKLINLSEELSDANNKLQKSVITDPLTGARNRLYLDECMKREWYRCMRNETALSILLVDVDNFKTLNDTNGHQAGDICLIKLVTLFNSELKRSTDVLCRYGGDEFVIVLPDTSVSDAMKIGAAIRKRVVKFSSEFDTASPVNISVSIGCASAVPDNSVTIDAFLAFADKALYRAKDAGRNCVVKAGPITNKTIAA
jgi:diguanylate cyclase (GGDEF)-like protein